MPKPKQRTIVFDTETTGVFPDHGDEKLRDRIVEIGQQIDAANIC